MLSNGRRISLSLTIAFAAILGGSVTWAGVSGLKSDGVYEVPVAGVAGVPEDISAVALQVTVSDASQSGYLTVYPCGSTRPDASNVNFASGEARSNLVVVGVGTGGRVCVSSGSSANLVVDVMGTFDKSTPWEATQPRRVLDTRARGSKTGKVAAGSVVNVSLPSETTFAALNVTAADADTAGYLTVFPCGAPVPQTSTVTFEAGRATPNLALVPVRGGKTCIYSSARTQIVVDLTGSTSSPTGFDAVPAQRLVDTRIGTGGSRLTAGSTIRVATGIRQAGAVALLNVAAAQSLESGFLTVYTCDSATPNTSNTNFAASQTSSALAIAQPSVTGEVCVYSSADTDVIVDATGWMTAPSGYHALPPVRLVDTRIGLFRRDRTIVTPPTTTTPPPPAASTPASTTIPAVVPTTAPPAPTTVPAATTTVPAATTTVRPATTTTTIPATTTTVRPTTTTTTIPATTTTVRPTTTTTTIPATTTTVRPTTTTTTIPATTTTTLAPPPALPAGSCSAPANTPGGADGLGGCFPGPDNTGVPPGTTLTAYTGPCRITVANTVIDAKLVNCDLQVEAPGLTVTRSQINGQVLTPESGTSTSGMLIQDSWINGANPYACINCGVSSRNYTLLRVEITGTNRGAYCEFNCTIQDSWIHGTNLQPVASNLAHASAVRAEQNTNLIHNSLACDYMGPFPNDEIGCSADMSGYPDFAPIKNNTIQANLFVANTIGAGFCAYGGGTASKPFSGDPTNATNIVFRDNVFQRGSNGQCGTYGPITDFATGRPGNIWTNNRWSDGTTVQPG